MTAWHITIPGITEPFTAYAETADAAMTEALLHHGLHFAPPGTLIVSEIRRALGSFPALPLNAEVAPRSVLTGWIAGEPLLEGLSLGDECELKDPIEGGAVVKCQRQEMQSDEIAKHLEAGKQVSRLSLALDDHVSFVLGEDLTVRKLKFLAGAVDQLENTEREDLRAEQDVRFALMTGEISRLFGVLQRAFRLSEGG